MVQGTSNRHGIHIGNCSLPCNVGISSGLYGNLGFVHTGREHESKNDDVVATETVVRILVIIRAILVVVRLMQGGSGA